MPSSNTESGGESSTEMLLMELDALSLLESSTEEVQKYANRMMNVAAAYYTEHFSEWVVCDVIPSVEIKSVKDPGSIKTEKYRTDPAENKIEIRNADPSPYIRPTRYLKEPIKAEYARFIAFLHEWSHYHFFKIAPHTAFSGYKQTTHHAFNEGFAMLVELLALENIVKQSTQHDLHELMLTRKKKVRVRNLYPHPISPKQKEVIINNEGYMEGYSYFFKPMYDQRGIQGIKEVLEMLDGEKVLKTKRVEPDYIQAINTEKIEDRFRPFLKEPKKFSWEIDQDTLH